MLIELSDTDEAAALWFNNWIADARNKPIAGDAFIADLLAARPTFVKESSCAAGPLPPPLREVSPPDLAQRLLATRKAMAARIAKRNLGTHVEGANMQVRRAVCSAARPPRPDAMVAGAARALDAQHVRVGQVSVGAAREPPRRSADSVPPPRGPRRR